MIAPPIPGQARPASPASHGPATPSAPHPAAALRPRRRLMQGLVRFTERFGSMLSRVLLAVLYFGLLGPFALFYRLFADPLHIRPRPQGNWSSWESANDDLRAARRQD